MKFVNSIIFSIFITLWGAIIPIIYFPVFFTKNSKMADHGAMIWAKVGLWVLKKLCGIDYEVVGLEKIPKEACIIACKHQSMWETIVMHLIFKRPVYAFKKELLKVPFYGWYIQKMSGITVDRKGGASALKSLIKQSKNYLARGQNIIIFPQGTRVPLKAASKEYPYQAGVAAIYLSCQAKVVPVALNSGAFWGKHQLIKKPGKITLEFLDPIETGLSKQEFLALLEKVMDERSDALAG